MRNMKVSAKLLFSFTIVIVLAVLIGATGIFGMYQMNVGDNKLYNGNYLPTVSAGDISEHVVSQRMHLRTLILYDTVTEPETVNKADTGLTQSLSEMDALLREYDGTIEEEDDRAAYTELMSVYEKDWLPFVSELRALGIEGRQDEAKALLIADGPVAIAAKLDELTSKLQAINLEDGKGTVDANSSLFTTMTFINIGILVFAIIVSLSFAFYISSLISKPLVVLTGFMETASSTGDIMLRPEDVENIGKYAKAKDELGRCIGATASFIKRMTDVSEELEVVASGDLTTDIPLLSDKDLMCVSLKKMNDNLNQMFGEINSSTVQVATGAKQIADGAQSLAQGSTEQAAAVQQLSASISEVAIKTSDNANMAQKASSLAETIKQSAQKGSTQMDTMMEAVKEINQASQSINKVIKVIDDIAFQTNILALNAAVEAARAGQHGKGFAVVAEEVRNLAAKSAEAAKDTGGLIANSMEKADLGAKIAEETAASLADIVSGINESTEIVALIARSSEEQTTAISQINQGIDQVAEVVQQNSATAEESAAASEELSGQSEMLQKLISQFKIKE